MDVNSCFICGSNKSKIKGLFRYCTLKECSQCGLQFLNPPPDRESLNEIYSDYYRAWGLEHSEEDVSNMKKRTFIGYLKKIKKYTSSGRLLDVGCATGEFMSVAQEDGFDVYGVEISPYGIYKCKEMFGEEKVIGGKLKEADFPKNYFDVITLSDVIEHIYEPNLFLDIILNILKPGGILMIVTPDTSSWLRKLMGLYWPHYKKEHIFYYNRSNIKQYLSSKLDKVALTAAYKTLTLKYCLSILKAYSHNKFINKIVKILEYFPEGIKRCRFNVNIGEMFILYRKRDYSLTSKGIKVG